MEAMNVGIEKFLGECSVSGDAAYGAIKAVLKRLENQSTRSEARVFLAEIQRRFADSSIDCFKKYNFRIHDVWLNDSEGILFSFSLSFFISVFVV
jgi:methionine S-methyltransferase